MAVRTFFSPHFKQLRQAHDLTGGQMADLLHIKSKVSISQFESATSLPKPMTLVGISNLFAVSLDWLLQPGYQPYNEDKISHLEKMLYTFTTQIPAMSDFSTDYYAATWFMRDPIGQYYLDPATHTDYSLSVRANIIYCLNVLIQVTDKRLKHSQYSELETRCRKILEDYIVHKKNITIPVFDITKEPT